MQLSHFIPGQVVRTFHPHGGVSNSVTSKEYRSRESTLSEYWKGLSVKILVAIVKCKDHGLGQILPAFQSVQQVRKIGSAITRLPKPFHLQGKNGRRGIDLVVGVYFSKEIVGNAVVHQDRHAMFRRPAREHS